MMARTGVGANAGADQPPALVNIIAGVAATFLMPWAISKMWQWFVVPLGVPAIGYWHGMGFWLFVLLISAVGTKEPILWLLICVTSFAGGFFAMLNMQ